MLLERLSTFSFIDLVILVLATYRLSIMMANDWEAGPAGLLSKLRERAGLLHSEAGDPVMIPGSFIDGFMCTHCNSVWVGVAFTILYAILMSLGLPAYLLFLPLALSGASVITVRLLGTG